MSWAAFARCPAFEPGRSALAARVVVCAQACAGVALALAQVPAWSKALAVPLLVWSAWRALRVHAFRTAPTAVVRIVPRDDGRWILVWRDGRACAGPLAGDCYINRWLVVVVVRDGWRTHAVPVAYDALAADAHRRLRVMVRWGPTASARPASP